jgi:hypothetical protein
MLDRLRSRLTYANVTATLALFAALGGSSYAAVKITGREVQNNSLTGVDIRNDSLRSGDVRDGSLRARDFKADDVPSTMPNAYSRWRAPDIGAIREERAGGGPDAVPDSYTAIGGVDVPAGSYVVVGKAVVANYDGTAASPVACVIPGGGIEIDASRTRLAPATGNDRDVDTLAFTLIRTLREPGRINLSCTDDGQGDARISWWRITAISARSVTNEHEGSFTTP